MARITTKSSVAFIALALILVALWPIRAEVSEQTARSVEASHALDGQSFKGMFGPPDGSSDRADELHFRDGRFWSKNCVPCGFLPGPYRAWVTAEGTRFEGVLQSPERGRFLYQGLVKDGKVYARLNWRKERWYWTIDKDFRFEGVRAERSATVSVEDMTRVALAARPESDECRP